MARRKKRSVDNGNKKYLSVKAFVIIVLLIFVIQIVSSIMILREINEMNMNLVTFSKDLNFTKSQLNNKIELLDKDFQNNVRELSEGLLDIEINLTREISSVRAKTSADFSGIISSAISSVVTIKTDVAQGTGFIISEDGYVVTNAHVLSGATSAVAITSEQESKSISLIGYDFLLDLALLKIDGNFKHINFANSDEVVVGEKVIAIGNPLGLSFSVSEGIVSAIDRVGENGLDAYIQIDAALNPGNSGGPLINTDGEVIGINNFKIAGENLGFALESNFIFDSINDIGINELNRTIV